MRIVTVITENYLSRAAGFLDSAARITVCPVEVVCIGFDGPIASYPYLRWRRMERHPSMSHGMLQHGRALDAIPDLGADETVVQVDADIEVQRDLTDAEVVALNCMDERDFLIGPNAGPNDTLGNEAWRIGMDGRPFAGDEHWKGRPVFNCGAMAAKPAAWRSLRDLYERHFTEMVQRSRHRCRCQWLQSWCLSRLGLWVQEMPRSMHAHGHFGVPDGVDFRDGRAMAGDEPVLFRHKLPEGVCA